jgi:hypothetical protein
MMFSHKLKMKYMNVDSKHAVDIEIEEHTDSGVRVMSSPLGSSA